MARALGETAPLLVIGMVALSPKRPPDLPIRPRHCRRRFFVGKQSGAGFAERTAAAIITLMVFLIVMNGAAVYLRKKWEFKW